MNESFKFLRLLLAIRFATRSNGESSTCVTVYKEGGAPAVFQSPKCPPLDSLKLRFHHHHHHHHNLKHRSLPIGDTSRSPKVPRGSHPFSWSLSLSVFLLLIALIPFYLAYIAETALSTSILFPFRLILVSCSEFSMAKDFF